MKKSTVIDRIASEIADGYAPSDILDKEGISLASLQRYIRWAKRDGLLPRDMQIDGDQFVVAGKKAKRFLQERKVETAVIFNDLHCPFQDWRAIDVMCQIIEVVKPDHLFENGDGLDAWPFSKFVKEPAKRQLAPPRGIEGTRNRKRMH